MAGEWIKFEAATPEKPEVFAITAALGWDDPDLTVGKLLKIWRWFDQQTLDGNAAGVNLALLDRIAGASGFAQAMYQVGWLDYVDGTVSLPNFVRHNGETAKTRALTAKRVGKYKANTAGNATGNATGNAAGVTSPLPKEEKKTEEKKQATPKPRAPAAPAFDGKAALAALGVDGQIAHDWLVLRAGKRAPVSKTALDQIIRQAALADMSLEAALAMCCRRGWTGFDAEWARKDKAGVAGAGHLGERARQFTDTLTGRSRSDDATIIDLN
jgi:hypothetical protein